MLITANTSKTRMVAVIDNRECFWPDVCQENANGRTWRHANSDGLEDINEPLGRRRADQLAHLLGMDAGMILTDVRVPLCDRDTSETSRPRDDLPLPL